MSLNQSQPVNVPSSAGIGGTGTSGQVPFFTASNTVGGSTSFTWNNTTKHLSLGANGCLVTDCIDSASSAGTLFKSYGDVNCLLLGAGSGQSALFYDGVTITGTTTLATTLTGILKAASGVVSAITDGAGYLKSDGSGNYSFDTPTSGWSLTGNSGTTAGTNFIGTTDDVDLVFKRNNVLCGRIGTTGNFNNTFFGENAGVTGCTGGYGGNVLIGSNAGKSGTELSYSVMIGRFAGYRSTTPLNNVFVGTSTGYENITGGGNTLVGHSAGYNVLGSGNVMLGTTAGQYETGSNSFYVDNQDRTDTAGEKAGALMYGTFNATPTSQTLRVNATMSVLGTHCTFGGMYAYNKAIPFNITVANTYHALHLVTAGDIVAGQLNGFTFNAGRAVDANITSEANGTGGKLRIVCSAAHGLTTGDLVVLGNMNNAAHNKPTRITTDGTNPTTEFLCDDITYVAGAGASAGTVDEPAYLKASAGSAGTYFASFTIDGTATSANKAWKWELNLDITAQDNVVSERNSTNSLASMSSNGNIVIADGQKLWLSAKNSTDTTDYTIKNLNINLHKL